VDFMLSKEERINGIISRYGLEDTNFDCSFGADFQKCMEDGCAYHEQCENCYNEIHESEYVLDGNEELEEDGNGNLADKVCFDLQVSNVAIMPKLSADIPKKDISDKKMLIIDEIIKLKNKICLNFIEIGKKISDFKEITGNNFKDECQEMLGIKYDAAINLIRTYEKFKNFEYSELIHLIPYSGWVLLSKKSVDEKTVKQIIETLKDNKNKLKIKDVQNLIESYNSPDEDQKNNSISIDYQTIIEKIRKSCLNVTNKQLNKHQNLDFNNIIIQSLNEAFEQLKKMILTDSDSVAS